MEKKNLQHGRVPNDINKICDNELLKMIVNND